jgi:hypothetical protein
MTRRDWTLGLAFLLCGGATCLAQPTPTVQQSSVAPSQPDKKSDDYRNGFSDGCMHATSGNLRNEPRYATNVSYHAGWDVGFKSCYSHNTINTNGDPNGPLKGLF